MIKDEEAEHRNYARFTEDHERSDEWKVKKKVKKINEIMEKHLCQPL
jgi:hypothetical protein